MAKERYEDLCEYFCDAKDILKSRDDFKAWLGRVKWHICKAEELSAENDDLRDQLAMRDRFQKQEPILDKIRAEIEQAEIGDYIRDVECFRAGLNRALNIIDKHKAEGNEKE